MEHLDASHAIAVLDHVLDTDTDTDRTPGELRAAARRAAVVCDPALARRRHETGRRTAGVRARPGMGGMAQVVIDCTAVQAGRVRWSV